MMMTPQPKTDLIDFIELVKDMAHVLISCGCSSNRVEALSVKLGLSYGIEVEVMAIPTGVWIVARQGEAFVQELTRIKHWQVDLDKLSRLNDLVESIHQHKFSLSEARQCLKMIDAQSQPYPYWLMCLAGATSGAGIVAFYQGSNLEVLLAGFLGLVAMIARTVLEGSENRRYLSDFICALLVACLTILAGFVFSPIDDARLIIGGIISQVPGLTFVNAIHEIAQKNLVSGSAKLIDALVIGISLAFGVVAAKGLYQLLEAIVSHVQG